MNHADRARQSPLPGMGGGTAGSGAAPAEEPQHSAVPPQGASASLDGGYYVDVEGAPQAIADLRWAANLLEAEAGRTTDLANIVPPGLDVVSANAVRVFCEAAVGTDGSLRLALEGAVRRFRADADKLEASLRSYLQVDEISLPPARTLRFDGPP